MFQLLGVEVTKSQLSFDTTVISRVQKVGSIVPLESRIYAVWSLNIEGGNILYNSVLFPKLYTPSTLNIQMKLILLWVWAERAVLGRAKTALKFKYEIEIG